MTSSDIRDDQLPAGAGESGTVEILPAATVIVCRGEPMEVLMMRRHEQSSFVPGVWVFPGGVLDPADRRIASSLNAEDPELSFRVCALRELFEETGIWLGEGGNDLASKREQLRGGGSLEGDAEAIRKALDGMVLTSRWITPEGMPKRFDTWFYLSASRGDVEPTSDQVESTELRWIKPSEALALHQQKEFPMVFPTLKNLEQLLPYSNVGTLLQARRGATIEPVQPVVVVQNGKKRIVIGE